MALRQGNQPYVYCMEATIYVLTRGSSTMEPKPSHQLCVFSNLPQVLPWQSSKFQYVGRPCCCCCLPCLSRCIELAEVPYPFLSPMLWRLLQLPRVSWLVAHHCVPMWSAGSKLASALAVAALCGEVPPLGLIPAVGIGSSIERTVYRIWGIDWYKYYRCMRQL